MSFIILYNCDTIFFKKEVIRVINVLKFETPLVSQFSMELDSFCMKLHLSPYSTIVLYDLIKKMKINER